MCDIKTPLPLRAGLSPLLFMVPGFSHLAGWAGPLPTCPSHFTHTIHRKYLLVFSQISFWVSLLPLCFNLFICVPLPVFFVKEESTVREQQKCLVRYNLCPLLGTTRARNHKKAWQNRACSLAESEGIKAPLTFILSPFFCRGSVLGIKITSYPWQMWLMGCHGGQMGTGYKCPKSSHWSPTTPRKCPQMGEFILCWAQQDLNHKSRGVDSMIPCESLPTWPVLWFCDVTSVSGDVTSGSVTGLHHCVTLTWANPHLQHCGFS